MVCIFFSSEDESGSEEEEGELVQPALSPIQEEAEGDELVDITDEAEDKVEKIPTDGLQKPTENVVNKKQLPGRILKPMEVDEKSSSQSDSTSEMTPSKENFPFLAEHDYFATPVSVSKQTNDTVSSDGTISAEEDGDADSALQEVLLEHNYCRFWQPIPEKVPVKEKPEVKEKEVVKQLSKKDRNVFKSLETESEKELKTPKKKRKQRAPKLTDITESLNRVKRSRELEPPKIPVQFKQRIFEEERKIFYDIFSSGIDVEDVDFLRKTYESLLQSDDPLFYWLNDILWVDHAYTNIPDPSPPKKRRKIDESVPRIHTTGNTCI